jgi:predicted RNase H-like nuclease (RuvC/YqgF family)
MVDMEQRVAKVIAQINVLKATVHKLAKENQNLQTLINKKESIINELEQELAISKAQSLGKRIIPAQQDIKALKKEIDSYLKIIDKAIGKLQQ